MARSFEENEKDYIGYYSNITNNTTRTVFYDGYIISRKT